MDITPVRKPVFTIDVPTIGKISCRTCTLGEYRQLRVFKNLRNILESVAVGDIPQTLKTIETIWAAKYIEAIDGYIGANKDIFAIPTDGKEEKGGECRLKVFTISDKLAADYANMSFAELQNIDIIDYRLISADAYKHMIMMNKPDAVKYLNGCWAFMHDMFTAEYSFSGEEISII